MITAGELLVRTLIKAGVKNLFGLHGVIETCGNPCCPGFHSQPDFPLHGAHLETLFQACIDQDIDITDTRHEVAAGHAAEGYARALNTLGVAMVTAGPGFTNVITSIANAYLDRTPILYLTGSAALRDAETNTLQAGIDQVAVAKPITKWAHQITVPEDIPRLLSQAIRIATSGPTGPVLLDLPIDVLTTEIDETQINIPETIRVDYAPSPQAQVVDDIIDRISEAERPIIMLGAGAWQSHCRDELQVFLQKTGIPVYSDFQAHGLLPADHPLYAGTFHKLADLSEPDQRPDVVLALGVRFGLFTLGGGDRLVPAAATLIHVEIDPKEIGRLRHVDIPVVADGRELLRALNARVDLKTIPDFSTWNTIIKDAREARIKRLSPALQVPTPPIHPYQAVTAVVKNIDEDTIIIGDGAESYHWLNEVIHQNQPGGYITHGFLGAVGFGMGLAIGAQTAQKDKRVLCLTGDGGVGFTIAEFDTMVRHNLPIVVVVMNNGSWGASQHFQEIVSGKERLLGTQLGNTNYHEVAAGFGCHAQKISRIEELGPAIRTAFASGKPACLNVIIDIVPLPPELELLMSRH